jgi:hypothetical protein
MDAKINYSTVFCKNFSRYLEFQEEEGVQKRSLSTILEPLAS